MKMKQHENDTGEIPYAYFEYGEHLDLRPLTDETLEELGFKISNGENDDHTWFTWWFVIVGGIMLTTQASDELSDGENYYVHIAEDNLLPGLDRVKDAIKYTTTGRVKMLINVLKGE